MKQESHFVEQSPSPTLSFKRLREQNVARCDEAYQGAHAGLDGWDRSDWALAVTGEWGEACNLMKKMNRGENVPIQKLAHEFADTVIYLDLIAAKHGIDLGAAVREKFNIVSDRVNSKRYL